MFEDLIFYSFHMDYWVALTSNISLQIPENIWKNCPFIIVIKMLPQFINWDIGHQASPQMRCQVTSMPNIKQQ